MSGTNPGSTSSPFNQLLEVMARHKASDLFISVGSPVQMKINGNMVAVTAARRSCVRPSTTSNGSASRKRTS